MCLCSQEGLEYLKRDSTYEFDQIQWSSNFVKPQVPLFKQNLMYLICKAGLKGAILLEAKEVTPIHLLPFLPSEHSLKITHLIQLFHLTNMNIHFQEE